MSEISRFYGITIYMFYNEHKPPHIHAKYQDYGAVIEIVSGKIKGRFPKRALNMINEWIRINKNELSENWQLSEERKPLKKVKPLT